LVVVIWQATWSFGVSETTVTGPNPHWTIVSQARLRAFQEAGWASSSSVEVEHLALALLLTDELRPLLPEDLGDETIRFAFTGVDRAKPANARSETGVEVDVREIYADGAPLRQALLAGSDDESSNAERVYARMLRHCLQVNLQSREALKTLSLDNEAIIRDLDARIE
jgi:hypothetical protein